MVADNTRALPSKSAGKQGRKRKTLFYSLDILQLVAML
jgi:hypothetical protein